MIKKVTKKTVQITKPELAKCHANKEFEANVITFKNTNPPPPPGMPKWFKTWSQTEFKPLKNDVSEIKTDVSDLKTRMTNVETKLTRVITLNKLKS